MYVSVGNILVTKPAKSKAFLISFLLLSHFLDIRYREFVKIDSFSPGLIKQMVWWFSKFYLWSFSKIAYLLFPMISIRFISSVFCSMRLPSFPVLSFMMLVFFNKVVMAVITNFWCPYIGGWYMLDILLTQGNVSAKFSDDFMNFRSFGWKAFSSF